MIRSSAISTVSPAPYDSHSDHSLYAGLLTKDLLMPRHLYHATYSSDFFGFDSQHVTPTSPPKLHPNDHAKQD
jgi:hypothetical protein